MTSADFGLRGLALADFICTAPVSSLHGGGQSAKAKKLGSRSFGNSIVGFCLLLGLVGVYCWGLLGAGLFLLLGAGEFYYCCGLVGIITAVGRWVFTAGAGGSLLLGGWWFFTAVGWWVFTAVGW